MTFLWILLGIVYIACWVYFGLATFRKGHYGLFWGVGFFLPFLWIVGALIAPTPAAAAKALRRTGDNSRLWRTHDNDDIQDQPARDAEVEKAAGCGYAASVGGRAGRAG
jgi:uncharacterized membrane protein